MEINGKSPSIVLDSYLKNVKDKKKIAPSSGQGSNEVIKGDRVDLSQRVREIQEAKGLLDSLPDTRQEKVAEIKKRIENGTYKIEGQKIAFSMVKEALLYELL